MSGVRQGRSSAKNDAREQRFCQIFASSSICLTFDTRTQQQHNNDQLSRLIVRSSN